MEWASLKGLLLSGLKVLQLDANQTQSTGARCRFTSHPLRSLLHKVWRVASLLAPDASICYLLSDQSMPTTAEECMLHRAVDNAKSLSWNGQKARAQSLKECKSQSLSENASVGSLSSSLARIISKLVEGWHFMHVIPMACHSLQMPNAALNQQHAQ